ncbi:tail fiber domain-containing protein, partial [Escherichia coli]|nr:tail fiber domain-containing protein [Escherichia coli]
MADQIFTGSGFKLFYNDDTANRIPDNAGNELVNELAAMPSFGIDSQVQTIEVYDSGFSEKLLSEKTASNIPITVNYVADCTAHKFLDEMTESQEEFQLTLQYDVTDGLISYSMVNGA